MLETPPERVTSGFIEQFVTEPFPRPVDIREAETQERAAKYQTLWEANKRFIQAFFDLAHEAKTCMKLEAHRSVLKPDAIADRLNTDAASTRAGLPEKKLDVVAGRENLNSRPATFRSGVPHVPNMPN